MPATAPAVARALDERLSLLHDVDHPVRFLPQFADKAAWEVRAAALRQQIEIAEGLWPMPPKTPLHANIWGKIARDGYTIEKVYFASLPGHYVSGNLYRPTSAPGKRPVILSPHGHWPGGRFYKADDDDVRKQLASAAEATDAGATYPMQARCAMLARMGCIVFMYDMVGYGDSQSLTHRVGFTDVESTLRLQSFMGLQTWNSIRALDFVSALPDADRSRIGITGASGGATQTLILSAIDDRIAAAFPAVMVSESMQGGCICENAPLLRVDTNNAEIASLIAPRPLGMTAANDWTIDLLTHGFPQIHDIYALYGAAGNVAAWHRPFPHNYNQVSRELMYSFFDAHFKLGLPEPMKELPFTPATITELSVYDADHPRPGDSTDAAGVRKWMTETSDAQIAELAKDRAAFHATAGAALRCMAGEGLPGRDEIALDPARSTRVAADGCIVEKGTIVERRRHARVPYVAIIPKTWNGGVVVWADASGRGAMLDDGKPTAAARQLIDKQLAVIAPDVLGVGDSMAAQGVPAPADRYAKFDYPGYHFGYNRAIMAERADDIVATIAMAGGWEGTREVRLVAGGKVGPAGLIALVMTRDAKSDSQTALGDVPLKCAAIDLDHLDFAAITKDSDEQMLPGILKYGGVDGLIALCDGSNCEFWNAPPAHWPVLRQLAGKVTFASEPPMDGEVAGWIIGAHDEASTPVSIRQ